MKRPERAGTQPSKPSKPAPPSREPRPRSRDRAAETGAGTARRRESAAAKAKRAEVKRFTRHARRRRLGWLTVLGIVATTAALIAVAVFSPILALREIRIDGTTRLDPAAIEEAVSGQLGTPLALLDEGRLRDELGEFSGIRSYATELVPPGTLVIHVVERSPLAAITTPAGFDVVDVAGVVLETSPARPEGLPLLQMDEDGVDDAAFAAMAEVLVALPPDVLAQVDSIAAGTRDDVTFTLAGSGQRVVWGSATDSDRKADLLAALLTRFASAGPGEYDVSAPGSAVFHAD